METKTCSYKALKFDELTDEAKRKAVEQLYDINLVFDWWDGDCYLELSEKEIEARHIKMSEKWWEHQGNIPGEYPAYSGLFKWKALYFDIDRGQYIQFDQLEVTDDNIFRVFLRIPKRLWEKCSYYFEAGRRNNTRLVLESSESDFTDRERDIIIRAEKIFSDKVHEAWVMLRRDYEYRISTEGIEEAIRTNDLDFFEDGRHTKTVAAGESCQKP